MLNRVFQSFATQHVHIQVLTTFYANGRLHFQWHFTVLDLAQFADRNDLIFRVVGFRANAASFGFFIVQQPERVHQRLVVRFSDLNTSNHVVASVQGRKILLRKNPMLVSAIW
ncbi:hypothetical protein D3C78_1228430 [compost metagenome]